MLRLSGYLVDLVRTTGGLTPKPTGNLDHCSARRRAPEMGRRNCDICDVVIIESAFRGVVVSFWPGGPMTMYYVDQNARPTGEHEVHTHDCRYLPDEQNRLYLGDHESCESAVQEAKTHYSKVDGCYNCAIACHEW